MNSKVLSTASALVLLASGLSLLFASDAILPAVEPGFAPGASWIGQVLAAALLSLASLNHMNRSAVLGGIYGRPVAMTNTMFYFIAGISMLQFVIAAGFPSALVAVTAILLLFAAAYSFLLFRGPFPADRPGGMVGQSSN